jgi:pentose-5-phosphate-3-epimerase
MSDKYNLCPSILSNDPADIQIKLVRIKKWRSQPHLDIADGRLVRNVSITPATFKKIVWPANAVAHLMVMHPLKWVNILTQAGLRRVIIHVEAKETKLALRKFNQAGFTIGLGFLLNTPISKIKGYPTINWIHLMTGRAGFYGSRFNTRSLIKLSQVKNNYHPHNISCDVGLNFKNIPAVVKAGATTIVVGSYIWAAGHPEQHWARLQKQRKSASVV